MENVRFAYRSTARINKLDITCFQIIVTGSSVFFLHINSIKKYAFSCDLEDIALNWKIDSQWLLKLYELTREISTI